MHRCLNIGVFGSGRGSNFSAILSAIQQGKIPNAVIRVVISNNSTAGILDIAQTNGIPIEHLSEKKFSNETEFVEHVLATLRSHDVNFIVLAGYMKRIPARIIVEFRNRIINIHPALLPKFGGHGMYGKYVHEAVIAAKEKISGATVHVVDEMYDHGAIVLQKTIDVDANDTAESLAAKILTIEHELYPDAIAMIAEGRILSHDKLT